MKRLIIATTLAALATLPLAQAVAAGPDVEQNELVFALVGQDCGGGVTYDINLVGSEVIRDFGERLSIQTTLRGTVVADDGTTLRVLHSWQEDYDFVAGTLTITGVPFGTRVEKSSLRFHDRGRLVLDLATFGPIFMAGKFGGPPDPHGLTCDLIALAQA